MWRLQTLEPSNGPGGSFWKDHLVSVIPNTLGVGLQCLKQKGRPWYEIRVVCPSGEPIDVDGHDVDHARYEIAR
jgi:hypothetical protein